MTTRDEERTTTRRLISGAVLVYQQVAAVIAAFALIAFFSHLFDFEWHGFIANLVGQWNEYARPAMKWLLHYAISVPFGWLGWHIEVPLWLRDYLGVGLALTLSFSREVWRINRSRQMRVRFVHATHGPRPARWPKKLFEFTFWWAPVMMIVWPAAALLFFERAGATAWDGLRNAFIAARRGNRMAPVWAVSSPIRARQEAVAIAVTTRSTPSSWIRMGLEASVSFLLVLAPLLYFGVLLVVNYTFLRAGAGSR